MFESIFRALTRYSLIWWAGASVLLLVSACTTVPVERATPSVSQQPAAKTGERPAAGGLSNELIYEFLLGDVDVALGVRIGSGLRILARSARDSIPSSPSFVRRNLGRVGGRRRHQFITAQLSGVLGGLIGGRA